nr:unnamed protein product [Callosobruchus chinensis]
METFYERSDGKKIQVIRCTTCRTFVSKMLPSARYICEVSTVWEMLQNYNSLKSHMSQICGKEFKYVCTLCNRSLGRKISSHAPDVRNHILINLPCTIMLPTNVGRNLTSNVPSAYTKRRGNIV